VSALADGNNAFAIDMYRHLRSAPGNVAFSPASITIALGMTRAGARGETANQIARAMHFTLPEERLNPAFASLMHEWTTNDTQGFELHVANRLWADRSEPFVPGYLTLTRDSFGAAAAPADFQHAAEAARGEINRWVAHETRDKILDLIPAGGLDSSARLVLTNAIYFKARWADAFRTSQTVTAPFNVDASTRVPVPMMHRTGNYSLAEIPGGQMLVLPYQGGTMQMLVMLPNRADGLPALEEQLRAPAMQQWINGATRQLVAVALPRFRTTSRASLHQALAAMGMPMAFSARADFGGISTRPGIQLSEVFHQAFVDVNEEGTEAAAATAVVAVRGMAMPSHTFTADHPFVYAIYDARSHAVLFLGRVSNPAG
jgi:serpin B